MNRLILVASIGLFACADDSTGTETSVGSHGDSSSGSAGSDASATVSATGGSNSASGSGGTTGAEGTSSDAEASSTASDTGQGGTFPCGDALVCSLATQYCEETVGGAVGNPPSYQCLDIPGECDPPADCQCLSMVPCAGICEMVRGGAKVTCQAP